MCDLTSLITLLKLSCRIISKSLIHSATTQSSIYLLGLATIEHKQCVEIHVHGLKGGGERRKESRTETVEGSGKNNNWGTYITVVQQDLCCDFGTSCGATRMATCCCSRALGTRSTYCEQRQGLDRIAGQPVSQLARVTPRRTQISVAVAL